MSRDWIPQVWQAFINLAVEIYIHFKYYIYLAFYELFLRILHSKSMYFFCNHFSTLPHVNMFHFRCTFRYGLMKSSFRLTLSIVEKCSFQKAKLNAQISPPTFHHLNIFPRQLFNKLSFVSDSALGMIIRIQITRKPKLNQYNLDPLFDQNNPLIKGKPLISSRCLKIAFGGTEHD